MSNDNFKDIPDLGPASDDLDPAQIPTLSTPAKKPKAKIPKETREPVKTSTRLFTYGLFILLILVGTVAFWSYSEQVALQRKLATTNTLMARLQGRVNDLEKLVSATDDSASKSGAALQAQLRNVVSLNAERIRYEDDQIRKLWAIYQKYKPQIESLDKELKTVASSLDNVGLSLDKQAKSLAKTGQGLNTLETDTSTLRSDLSALEASLSKTESEYRALSEQLRNQELASQEMVDLHSAQLQKLSQRLDKQAASAKTLADLKALLQEHEKRLESIDASRRQVNEELLLLKKRIAQMQNAQPVTP